MPDPARRNAFVVTVVGLAFCVFFQITKHTPALARVNPFADDPYDAVSSAAVQFVLFVILLTLLRAFRPAVSQDRLRLQFAAQLMASVAIAFSLLGDLIAMARHVPLWKGSSAGYDLLALTLCLLLWIAGAIVFLFVTNPPDAVVPMRPLGGRLGAITVPAVLVLFVYPERFRQTLAGAILTALCGMVLLFLVVWAIGTVFAPASPMPDPFDDLAELAASLGEKLRLRPLLVERGSPLPRFLRILLDWLNPRTHRWTLASLAGLLAGAFLVAEELAGPGSPHGNRRLLVIAVYLCLETAGVLTGYGLLARPLHLVRPADLSRRPGAPFRPGVGLTGLQLPDAPPSPQTLPPSETPE